MEDHGYLVIRDIPYLDSNGVQQNGGDRNEAD